MILKGVLLPYIIEYVHCVRSLTFECCVIVSVCEIQPKLSLRRYKYTKERPRDILGDGHFRKKDQLHLLQFMFLKNNIADYSLY